MDPLSQKLSAYAAGDFLPMHMPGHKRRPLHTPALPWAWDITEIDGFDDLHDPSGILAEGMAAAARLWGSENAFYLVGGSTAGLLSALHAALPRGSTLLVARNCHKSVYHGLELLDLTPVYLHPPTDPQTGLCGSIPPAAVERALEENPKIRALLLTSPTYDGVLSDLPALAQICHSRGVALLVDEAHGAHLGFGPFPAGTVAAGADVVVQSLHKTLPSLTQTALLHRQGDLVSPTKLARSLGIFQTSSPSYPLMASMEGCVALLEGRGHALAQSWMEALHAFDRAILPLKHLCVLCHGGDSLDHHPAFFGFDPSKLVICTQNTTLTGPRLMAILRQEHHIELEMAAPSYATAMTGLGDTPETLERLAQALLAVDRACTPQTAVPLPALPPIPCRVFPAGLALEQEGPSLPFAQCAGQVAGEYLWAYPPGIPLVVPGEVLTPDLLTHFSALLAAGVNLHAAGGSEPGHIRVCLAENP